MSTEKEEWRDVIGATSFSVSDHGNVKRKSTGRILVPYSMKSEGTGERYGVSIRKDGGRYSSCKVHILVITAFVGPVPRGYVVDHINGDPANNRLDNLRIVTHRVNSQNKQGRRFPSNVSEHKASAWYVFRLEKGPRGASVTLARSLHRCVIDAVTARDAACLKHGFVPPDKVEDYVELKCRCGGCRLSPSLAQAS